MNRVLPLVVFVCLMFCTTVRAALPMDSWTWQNPLPQGNSLHSVAYGNGLWVAVGAAETILISPDGQAWERRVYRAKGPMFGLANKSPAFFSVAYGKGCFVAVGEAGYAVTSTNGLDWTRVALPIDDTMKRVIYSEGWFIVEANCHLLTSSNGIVWNSSPALTNCYEFTDVAYGNGVYVLIGDEVASSTNGTNWTQQTLPHGAGNPRHVAFGNGTFAMLDTHGSIFRSTNGFAWSATGYTHWQSTNLTFAQGEFLLLTKSSLLVSTNGVNWSTKAPPAWSAPLGIGAANSGFVITGMYGEIWKSDTNFNYTEISSGIGISYTGLTHGNGIALAVGLSESGDTVNIATSTNGTTWAPASLGEYVFPAHTRFLNGKFWVTGQMGNASYIASSIDGTNWNAHLWDTNDIIGAIWSVTANAINSLTFGNSKYVAVATPGDFYLSTDGVTWTNAAPQPGTNWKSICFANGLFVAVGKTATRAWPNGDGVISVSTDGATWLVKSPTNAPPLFDIAYGDGKFVAVGGDPPTFSCESCSYPGVIYLSSNGSDWTPAAFTPASVLYSVTYQNGMFVGAGKEGVIVYSFDGITWEKAPWGAASTLRGVDYFNGRFTVVGEGGATLQSGDFTHPFLTGQSYTNGAMRFKVVGESGKNVGIQRSTNFAVWDDIFTYTNAAPWWDFTDLDPEPSGHGFYRIVSP